MKKPKISIAIIVIIVILVLGVLGVSYILNSKTNEATRQKLEDAILMMKPNNVYSVNEALAFSEITDIASSSNKYFWYDLENQKVVLKSLNEMLKVTDYDYSPTLPSCILKGFVLLSNNQDKLTKAIRNFSEGEIDFTNIKDQNIKKALRSFVNSAAFVGEGGSSKSYYVDEEYQVKTGNSDNVSNIVFTKSANTITSSTFDDYTCIEQLVIPSNITTLDAKAFEKLEILQDVYILWVNQQSFIKNVLGLRNVNVQVLNTNIDLTPEKIETYYLLKIFDINNDLIVIKKCVKNEDISFINNISSISNITKTNNEYYGDKHKGYKYQIDGQWYNLEKYNITSDLEIYPSDTVEHVALVAYNQTNNKYYDTLNSAFNEPGEIVLLKDVSISNNITIPSDNSLLIPVNNAYAKTIDGGASASPIIVSDKIFRRLIIEENVQLTIEGQLLIGGTIGYPGQRYQGHQSSWCGEVYNDGIIIVDKGKLDCYGFITGSGEIIAKSNSEVYQPFIVTDYAGGTNTSFLFNNGQSPFSRYTMNSIKNKMVIEHNALLIGHCNLYASRVFNKTDAIIVGSYNQDTSNKGLILLKEDATATITNDQTLVITSDDEMNNLSGDIGLTTITLSGGAVSGSLSMNIGITISTKQVDFPIPYNYKIILENGDYSLTNRCKLLPGSKLIVQEDATLTVEKESALYIFDGLVDKSKSGKYYPLPEMLQNHSYSVNADLIVNGKLIINGTLAGIIQTLANNSIIEINDAVLSKRLLQGCIQGVNELANNLTIRELKAQIVSDKQLILLEPNNKYISKVANDYVLQSFQYYDVDNEGHEELRIITDLQEKIEGSFNKATSK